MKNTYAKLALTLFVLLVTCGVLFFVLKNEEKCTDHTDSDLDGICDICEDAVTLICSNHLDTNFDGLCDVCYVKIQAESIRTECVDSDKNGYCDSCGKTIAPEDVPCTECVDSDRNGYCDSCGEEVTPEDIPCTECVDSDENGYCDSCGEEVTPENLPCTECVDSDENGYCDSCGTEVTPKIEYEINAFLILGKEITDYVIAYDNSTTENGTVAYEIQSFLYEKSGFLLDVVSLDSLTDEKYIAIKSAQKSGGEGFYVTLDEENLEIVSEFYNKTASAVTSYLDGLIKDADSNIEFTEQTINVRDISYEEFGAVGNGVTDDSKALFDTHAYANEYGHTVVAESGAKYYIGPMNSAIKIQTDTIWNNASFIIDDREITADSFESGVSVFEITSEYEQLVFDSESELVTQLSESRNLVSGASSIGLSLGYGAIVIIENSDASQKAVLLVDKNGVIYGSTPLTQDFNRVTKVRVIRADDTPITIEGGSFIRLINQSENVLCFERNIKVFRSNVTISSITYQTNFENESTPCAIYSPFINITDSSNILLSAAYLAAHPFTENGEKVQSHTVGIRSSLNLTLYGCVESNFYAPDGITPSAENSDILLLEDTQNIKIQFCRFNSVYIADGVNGLDTNYSVINKINYK